jgi:carbamoyl-phosphate synthase large subunit
VNDLTVLVTAAGAPGTAALLRALRMNGERRLRLIGTDMSPLAIGRKFCDLFFVVPPGSDPDFAATVLGIAQRERVDAVLPQSSHDLLGLAEARDRFNAQGIAVLVSAPETIRRANDKAETYALLERIGVRAPEWRRVRGGRALGEAAHELGYPDRAVCFKPVFSSGSRGFRVLDPAADRARQLLEERPGNLAMRLPEALELLPREGGPELLVMELARGGERTIDGIARGGRILLGHPKTREAMRAGLAMYFQSLDDPRLIETAGHVVEALGIDHFFNIQLVGEHVIEVNPRISTIVYQQDLNLPYLGLKHALGEISGDELAACAARIRPTRRALRYFDQVEWDDPPVHRSSPTRHEGDDAARR